jgi:hypothetical protein
VSHSTAAAQVVHPQTHVIERRIVHGGLCPRIDRLHEVDLAAHAAAPATAMSSSTFSRSLL